jgi:hypothetical protein
MKTTKRIYIVVARKKRLAAKKTVEKWNDMTLRCYDTDDYG